MGGHDYVFADKTVFLNAYLTGKLSTDLHNRTLGIEHQQMVWRYIDKFASLSTPSRRTSNST